MKNLFHSAGRLIFFGLAFFTIIFGSINLFAAEPSKVAVFPFKINAQNDLTFLKDGIYDMLASRLSDADKVQVLSREETEKALETVEGPINESTVQDIGLKLGADFVLFGSLTIFGNSVSIDAKMVDVSGSKPTIAFFDQSQGMDEVIPKINFFAQDINEKVFGRVIVSKQLPVQPQTEPVQPQAKQVQPQTEQPNARAHPEKLLQQDSVVSESEGLSKIPDSPSPTTRGSEKIPKPVWKSRSFSHSINGLALGDVYNNGKTEAVIITPHKIHIYRYENDRFIKIKEISESKYSNFIGVDVADINGNGYCEIFVTSLNAQKNDLKSFVLEYNGKNFIKIIKDSDWYYRVIELPGRGPVLFGQQQKAGGAHPFSGSIYEMVSQNSDYEPESLIIPNGKANLLGFAIGDVMNDEQNTNSVAYSKSDKIQIFGTSGETIWTGNEKYGGSTLYFELPKDLPGYDNRYYLPMRLCITDIDSDGKNEVIVIRNHELAGYKLQHSRNLTDFQIESLRWDKLGLAGIWKTRKFKGHVRDFAIADLDNDGKKELIAGIIIKEGKIIGKKPKSSIVVFDLGN